MKKLFPSDPINFTPCKMIIERIKRWKNNRENSLPSKKKRKPCNTAKVNIESKSYRDTESGLERENISISVPRVRKSLLPDHHFVREQRFVSSQFFELREREMGLIAKLKFMCVVFISRHVSRKERNEREENRGIEIASTLVQSNSSSFFGVVTRMNWITSR